MFYVIHSFSLTFLTVQELKLISLLPTAVEPVKESLRRRGDSQRAVPTASTSSLATVRQFITPGGMPASSAIAHSASADSGASSDGLITTVHPAASAGPT